MKAFFLAILFSLNVFACPNNVKSIKTGTVVNCDGWLVSKPQMQSFAKSADELELQKKLVLGQEHLQKLTEAEVEFYKRKNISTEKALSQSERQKTLIGAGAFILGVVMTGFAAKAAIEATR